METGNAGKKLPGTKAEAYRLIQEVALVKDKYCQRPGCGRSADCGHHVFPGRGKLATDFLHEAVISVCTQDHTGWAHNKPKEFKQFMIERLGEDRYYELRRLSYEHVEAMDYGEICERLRNELRTYRRGT
uniref:Uncharacterized protein n=1 Tax=viral metagenome TaxID=1070528 RepID=A0A6M3LLX7_9ZZZZ